MPLRTPEEQQPDLIMLDAAQNMHVNATRQTAAPALATPLSAQPVAAMSNATADSSQRW